jgi:hypothetical protein
MLETWVEMGARRKEGEKSEIARLLTFQLHFSLVRPILLHGLFRSGFPLSLEA